MLQGYPTTQISQKFEFQWAPTLGGECYTAQNWIRLVVSSGQFQWAPTLGGECYGVLVSIVYAESIARFNGHPPLGVNATATQMTDLEGAIKVVSMGTHPWG